MPADAYKEVFLFKFFGRSRHARLHLLDVTWTLTCGIIRAVAVLHGAPTYTMRWCERCSESKTQPEVYLMLAP